jgi:transposase
MEALSLDLRERVAAACDEGSRSQPEVAEDFGVSLSFVTKLLARRKLTGGVAAKPHAGGFASAVDAKAEAALRSLVAERPDATLAELADGLAERRGVRRSAPVICRAVRRLGLPRKKRRSTPPSATRRGSAASAGRSAGSSSGCPPARAWWSTSAAPRRR